MKLIDVHLYFGKWGFPIKPISTEGIVKLMDRMNIEKAVLMSALGIGYNFVEGNASLAKEIESWNQLFGYVYINGNYIEQSLKEMDYYLINDKFVGVKFQPEYSGIAPNDPKCDVIWEALEKDYRKPVLIHTWTVAEHNNGNPYSLPEYSVEIDKQYSSFLRL